VRAFVLSLLRALGDAGLVYAIGGSVASSYYGDPRSTQDIDLSLQLEYASVGEFVARVEHLGWYISPEEAGRAAQQGGSFSVNDGFWKADLFVVREDPFDVQALARRHQGTLTAEGDLAWLLAPEDVILHKLRWCGAALREKHLHDILAILRVQGPSLDFAHISRWATELNAGGLWASVLEIVRTQRGG